MEFREILPKDVLIALTFESGDRSANSALKQLSGIFGESNVQEVDLTENTSHYEERVYRISTPVILDDSSVKDFALGLNQVFNTFDQNTPRFVGGE